MDSDQATQLVEYPLRMVHTLRGDVPDHLVFHADDGTQFTSENLWDVLPQPGHYLVRGAYRCVLR